MITFENFKIKSPTVEELAQELHQGSRPFLVNLLNWDETTEHYRRAKLGQARHLLAKYWITPIHVNCEGCTETPDAPETQEPENSEEIAAEDSPAKMIELPPELGKMLLEKIARKSVSAEYAAYQKGRADGMKEAMMIQCHWKKVPDTELNDCTCETFAKHPPKHRRNKSDS